MDPTTMTVSELKQTIKDRGLSFAGLVEKSELIERAREALAKGNPAPSGPRTFKKRLSKFDCTIIDTGVGDRFDLAVVILHGFGATSQDFAGLCPMLASTGLQGKRVRWVLPQAPAGIMGVPAWWSINVQDWMGIAMGMASEADIAKLLRIEHEGLPDARRNLLRLLEELTGISNDLSYDKIVMSGFSQGAMTAIDIALSLPADKTLAGVLSMSGAPIVVDDWAKKAPNHPGMKVLLTHGKTDNVLPFVVSGWLKDLLEKGGLAVETAFHDQAHTLGPQHVIVAIRDFVERCSR